MNLALVVMNVVKEIEKDKKKEHQFLHKSLVERNKREVKKTRRIQIEEEVS